MPVRAAFLPTVALGVLLSVCIGCEGKQPGQREQPEQEQAAEREQHSGPTKPTQLLVEQSAAARNALLAWFECEECTDDELKRVVEYGEVVVPNLAATLHGGLSPSKREEVRQHLQETYRALAEYAKEHKGSSLRMSEQEYLDTYLENAEALYRLRAATALGRIGTPAARAALERGLTLKELRPEVRREVERALQGQKSAPI